MPPASDHVAAHRDPHGIVRLLLIALSLVASLALGVRPAAAATHWQAPLSGHLQVMRGFDPPVVRWGAGHRGVDLAAPGGAPVLAAGDGVVGFAGTLAGRGVVTVVHGSLRTTYEPVAASVRAGTRVGVGMVIGHLTPTGSHCGPVAPCLHWGLLRGDTYLDPLLLLGLGQLRLYPLDAVGAERGADAVAASRGSGAARWNTVGQADGASAVEGGGDHTDRDRMPNSRAGLLAMRDRRDSPSRQEGLPADLVPADALAPAGPDRIRAVGSAGMVSAGEPVTAGAGVGNNSASRRAVVGFHHFHPGSGHGYGKPADKTSSLVDFVAVFSVLLAVSYASSRWSARQQRRRASRNGASRDFPPSGDADA